MDSLKIRLLITVIAFGMLVGGAVGALLYYVFPQFYPEWYLGIVLFFLIAESMLICGVASYALKTTSVKMVNLYMASKVIKILASLVFVTIYYSVMGKEGIKNFVLVFVVFYGLYLFLETFLFSKIEREIKRSNKK